MAKHLHNSLKPKKQSGIKQYIGIESEKKFNLHFAECGSLIEFATKKQLRKAKVFANGAKFSGSTKLLRNGSYSTTKAVNTLTAGLPHSPAREVAETAQRARKNQLLAYVIEKICEYKSVMTPHAYMLTITLPNADMGALKDQIDHTFEVNTKFKETLRHTANNGRGLHLPAQAGGNVGYLGHHMSVEITVNKENMAKFSPLSLFHDHTHMILVFDESLDMTPVTLTQAEVPNMTQFSAVMPRAKAVLFQWFAEKNQSYILSPDAFDLKEAYDNKGNNDFVGALAEANKYAIKPELWGVLPDEPTTYSKKVFAEIMNSIARRKMHRNGGIFQEAQSFLVFLNKIGLLSAAMSGTTERVPDLYTHLSGLSCKDGHAKYVDDRELNAEQLLFFNREILGKVGFNSAELEKIEFPDNDKADLYKWLLSSFDWVEKGRFGLEKRLNQWSEKVSKTQEILSDKLSEGVDFSEIDEVSSALEQENFKYDDLQKAISATKLLYADGSVDFDVNWTKRIELLNALEMMNCMGLSSFEGSKSENEKLLLRLFDRQLLTGTPKGEFVHPDLVDALRVYQADPEQVRNSLLNDDFIKFDNALRAGFYLMDASAMGSNFFSKNQADKQKNYTNADFDLSKTQKVVDKLH